MDAGGFIFEEQEQFDSSLSSFLDDEPLDDDLLPYDSENL